MPVGTRLAETAGNCETESFHSNGTRCPMTQELILMVLLGGLIGLLWVMTLAIWEGKHTSGNTHEKEPAVNNDDIQHREHALKRHTIAA
jgi:hypothetical protein